MVESTRIRELTEFREGWRRWTQVVGLFALERRQRHAVDRDDYEVLHGELLQLLRGMVQQEASFQAVHSRELEQILAPWVTLESLAHADCVIVGQLFEQSTWVQRMLDGRPPEGSSRRWPGRFLLGAALFVASFALLLAFDNDQTMVASASRSVERWIDLAGSVLTAHGANRSVLTVGTAVVVVTILVVWRSARRA